MVLLTGCGKKDQVDQAAKIASLEKRVAELEAVLKGIRPMAEYLSEIPDEAKIKVAKGDIWTISNQAKLYKLETTRYPPNLDALISVPGDPDSKNRVRGRTTQYLEKEPIDPWDTPYKYKCPGTHNGTFDLYSCGPNTEDENGGGDDIPNW